MTDKFEVGQTVYVIICNDSDTDETLEGYEYLFEIKEVKIKDIQKIKIYSENLGDSEETKIYMSYFLLPFSDNPDSRLCPIDRISKTKKEAENKIAQEKIKDYEKKKSNLKKDGSTLQKMLGYDEYDELWKEGRQRKVNAVSVRDMRSRQRNGADFIVAIEILCDEIDRYKLMLGEG